MYRKERLKSLADDAGCEEDRSVIREDGGRDIYVSVTESLNFTQDDLNKRASALYLLNPLSRVLIEKLTGFAVNQEIPRIL